MRTPETTLGRRSDAEDLRRRPADSARAQLLAGIPVTDGRRELAGISTAVLEGGAGAPLVLLHGPGESAAN